MGPKMYPFRTRTPRSGVADVEELPAKRLKADARTRTGDPFITSEVLYQLSYVGAADAV
jgi:hypothetical protein